MDASIPWNARLVAPPSPLSAATGAATVCSLPLQCLQPLRQIWQIKKSILTLWTSTTG